MKEIFPPQKITVSTDNSIMEFQHINKEKMYVYIYTYSVTGLKTGSTVQFTEENLNKFLANIKLFEKD